MNSDPKKIEELNKEKKKYTPKDCFLLDKVPIFVLDKNFEEKFVL